MATSATLAAIRFGYGLPQPAGAPDTAEALLARLSGPDRASTDWPIAPHAPLVEIVTAMREARMATKDRKDPAFVAEQEVLKTKAYRLGQQAEMMTLARAVLSADGLRERLVAFWGDHFSVSSQRKLEAVLPFAMIEDAVRPNLAGSFGDMLVGVSLHPAMLIYLDQSSSIGPNSRLGKKQSKGLNENLAREVMELHSLGVGAAYTQGDVTELARLLTGVTVGPVGAMMFDDRKAEPGPKTVLGKTYAAGGLEDVRAVLRDLALHDGTAQHLARKLVVHFVSDQPDADLVAVVAAAYKASGGNLMQAYMALLTHPAAWLPETPKARQPYDFIVAAWRALGLSDAMLQAMDYKDFRAYFLTPMVLQGQPFKRPSGPNGFPEEAEEWITPQGLARRITFAMKVPERLIDPLPDPVALAQSCLAERASAGLLWAAARAEDRAQGVGLVLASAEFNRR